MWVNRRTDIQKMILRSFFWILNIDTRVSIGYFLLVSLLSKIGLSSVIYLFILCGNSLILCSRSLNLPRSSTIPSPSSLRVSAVRLFGSSDSVAGVLFA